MVQPHSNDVHRNHRLGLCNKSATLTDNKRGIIVLKMQMSSLILKCSKFDCTHLSFRKMLISPFSPSFALGMYMWITLFLPASHHYSCISRFRIWSNTYNCETWKQTKIPLTQFLGLPQAYILSSPRQLGIFLLQVSWKDTVTCIIVCVSVGMLCGSCWHSLRMAHC